MMLFFSKPWFSGSSQYLFWGGEWPVAFTSKRGEPCPTNPLENLGLVSRHDFRGQTKPLRKLRSIPGNIPQTLNHVFMKEILFHICVLGYLGFVPSGLFEFSLKLPAKAKSARRSRLGFPFWHCAFVHRRAIEELKWKGHLSSDTGFHLSSNGHAIWWWS